MRSIESRGQTYRKPSGLLDAIPAGGSQAIRAGQAPVVQLDGMETLRLALRLVDGAVVMGAGIVTHIGGEHWPLLPPDQMVLIAFTALAAVNLLQLGRAYTPWGLTGEWRPMALAPILLMTAVLAIPVTASMLAGHSAEWGWLRSWAGLAVGWIITSRMAVGALSTQFAGARAFNRRVLVVGDAERVPMVIETMRSRHVTPVPGDLDSLSETLSRQSFDDVVVALPWSDYPRVMATLSLLREFPVGVHLFPDDTGPLKASLGVSAMSGVPLVTLSNRPLSPAGRILKAAEDRVLAALIVVLGAPFLAAIAIAIKLDSPGPVLFRQKRYGYNNEVFIVYKFRSMVVHAPTPSLEQAKRGDPRITRVGRFLRRTSLDELPQLINVLQGSMSLVGPRPHAVEHQTYYQYLVDAYRSRHRMKPGITGWAQVNGFRGETSTVELMKKRVEYDLYYIDNWSIFLDLWILVLTPFSCLWGKNAY